MKASEYIELLKQLVAEHGDLECVDSSEDSIGWPEFNDDDGEPVFVLADRA